MTILESIYVTTFNEIRSGEYKTFHFGQEARDDHIKLPESKKECDVFVLEHTRNVLLYEWFKDNDQMEYLDGLFEYVLQPKTDPDLKGVSFKQLVKLISPETARAIGWELKSTKRKTN